MVNAAPGIVSASLTQGRITEATDKLIVVKGLKISDDHFFKNNKD